MAALADPCADTPALPALPRPRPHPRLLQRNWDRLPEPSSALAPRHVLTIVTGVRADRSRTPYHPPTAPAAAPPSPPTLPPG